MTTSAPLKILIAENNPEDGLILTKRIQLKLSDKMPIDIAVEVVPTLERALALAATANVTILDMNLDDAGPKEVLAAIPSFRHPVLVVTGDDDVGMHASCKLAGADFVFLKTELHGLCSAIIFALCKDLRESETVG